MKTPLWSWSDADDDQIIYALPSEQPPLSLALISRLSNVVADAYSSSLLRRCALRCLLSRATTRQAAWFLGMFARLNYKDASLHKQTVERVVFALADKELPGARTAS